MTIRVQIDAGNVGEIKAETILIPVLKGEETPVPLPSGLSALDRRMEGRLSDALASGDFKAGVGDRLAVYGPREGAGKNAITRCIFMGLGDAKKVDAEVLRLLGGRVGRESVRDGAGRMALVVPTAAALAPDRAAAPLAEGAILGAYRFDRYLTRKDDQASKTPRLTIAFARKVKNLSKVRAEVRRAIGIAEAQVEARDLSNEPPNVMYPESLAREARKMARKVGLKCQVMTVPEMEKRGMGAILAVGQGSARPPRMIVLEHGATKKRKEKGTLALIGKGITFDSGGLSLKPPGGMPEMKHDMSGAAAVFGAMRAIAELDLPIHVVGLLAAAENMPSSVAYRPGDIITAGDGQTIEILNTDAEGRLVMADALHHAVKTYAPDAIIDIATLTGAAVMAFGPWATAGVTNDDDLLDELRAAGEATGETVWPMPLHEAHDKAMRSRVADWKNSGGRIGGISTAGAFLRGFIGETPWVHLDIAGSGMTETQTPLHIGGGTGVGVRMLTEWVRSRCQ